MNKVISIHLRGVAFQLEESGYDALRSYLDKAERQLAANPDRAEIMADIEQAIADKFRALLSPSRNVVLASEVEQVIRDMGPVSDGNGSAGENASAEPGPNAKEKTEPRDPAPPRRLYRIKEGAMLGGVCNGLAAYLGLDVTLIRLVVAVLVFVSFGTVAIAYIVSLIIIPRADTAEEKKAAAGPSPTAQEFIRRAKQGYYDGMKAFPDREARREWKRKFKQEMKEWKHTFRDEFRWAPPSPSAAVATPPPGYHVVVPVLSTLQAVFFFIAAVAVVSLLATGAVFGVPLPGNLPVWAGIVIIVLLYKLLVSPFKAIRHQYRCQAYGWPVYWHPFWEIWKGIVGLFIFVFALFVADRLIPGFHQVLLDFRAFLQHAFESLGQWWGQKGTSC